MTPPRARGRWESLVSPAAAALLGLLVASGAVLLAGGSPLEALGALAGGAFGSPRTFASVTLVRACPLLVTGLAVALSFRSGVWNIGAEGQFYAGATAAVAIALATGSLAAALGGALVAGGLWAGVAALLRFRWGVSEVISTLMLNFVALDAVGWLVHGPLEEAGRVYPQSEPVPAAARLPPLWEGTRLHAGFPAAVLLILAAEWLLRRTLFGFRLGAVGLGREAARVSGRIDPDRIGAVALSVSGALAGLAGGIEATGVSYALYENLSPGYGYTAIAVALLGGLRPLGVLLAAVFLGALESGAGAMQREAGVPSVVVAFIEGIILLAFLALERLWKGGRRGGR